jgi:hypothetical protein
MTSVSSSTEPSQPHKQHYCSPAPQDENTSRKVHFFCVTLVKTFEVEHLGSPCERRSNDSAAPPFFFMEDLTAPHSPHLKRSMSRCMNQKCQDAANRLATPKPDLELVRESTQKQFLATFQPTCLCTQKEAEKYFPKDF